MTNPKPNFSTISVDVETSGPNPAAYALLSIGACTLSEPRQSFYVELQPDKPAFLPEAMLINHLSMEKLTAEGMPACDAMQSFANWLDECVPDGKEPLFLAFNAPFDWMFVNDYFYRYLKFNPFGHAALDAKSYYMGLKRVDWSETSMQEVSHIYSPGRRHEHHALDDAINLAVIFEKMLKDTR